MDVAELFRCCRTGDVEKLRYLIDVKDIEVNARDHWDSTPLYYACLCGHEDMVELLLKNGSRCEANTFDGERCLYGALTDDIRRTLQRYNAINSDCMRRESYDEFLRRSFEQGVFADIYFVVHGETIPAHRVILAARSTYFAEMLQTKWQEKMVFFPRTAEFNPGQFRNMLKYFYTGKLDVPFEEYEAYLYLALQFELWQLKKLIKSRLEKVKTFGASKRGFVRVTMINIDPAMEGKNLKEDFTKLAEVALPEPFRSQQLPEVSMFISHLLGDVDYELDDFSSFSDVCFDVQGYEFYCNKVFFCHRSDYFKALFEFSQTAATNQCLEDDCRITIHDVTPAVFAVVVAYLYIDDAEENWQSIYDVFTVTFHHENAVETVELAATNDKEAAKYFGLYLYHKGNVQWLEDGNKGVSVSVRSSRVESTYKLWRNREKIYAEATSHKKVKSSQLPESIPCNLSHLPTAINFPQDVCEADKPQYVLKNLFGYETFHSGQLEAIQTILNSGDCLILMPTGGGKSMIYVISAIIKQGLTVIIEPLKFLMEDQVCTLREKGIPALYFNSSLKEEADNIIHFLTETNSQYIILFTSPECIFNTRLQSVLKKWKNDGKLGFITVDEAHCIDSWGVGFIPDYTRLGELHDFGVSMVAVTGTATPDTANFIIDNLKLINCKTIKTSFLRTNITIEVLEKKDKAKQYVAKLVCDRFDGMCGIVYCAKRQDVVEVAHQLKAKGVTVTYVHGALSDMERAKHMEQWTNGNALVMCATKCFGMGIDKADVRYVVHFTVPSCLEEYYQEIGRAGRDGQPATCISLFKFKDRSIHLHHIIHIDDEVVQKQRYEKLNRASYFFSNYAECRHSNILAYFGEETVLCEDRCDVCIKGTVPTEICEDSMKQLAALVVQCLIELIPHCQTGTHASVHLVCQVLMGSSSADVIVNNLDKLDSYGKGKTILHGRSAMKSLNKFVYKLIIKDYIKEALSNNNKTVALKLGQITELLSGSVNLY